MHLTTRLPSMLMMMMRLLFGLLALWDTDPCTDVVVIVVGLIGNNDAKSSSRMAPKANNDERDTTPLMLTRSSPAIVHHYASVVVGTETQVPMASKHCVATPSSDQIVLL